MVKSNYKGFTTIALVAVLLVVGLAAGAGWLFYQKHHSKKIDQSPQAQNSSSDPYKDWETYYDTDYHYSFKYPTDWVLRDNNVHGTRIKSPLNAVIVTYGIDEPLSDSLVPFLPSTLTHPDSINEDLTIIGGTISSSPIYQVVDTALLNKYPLSLGESGQLPNVATFTVKGTNYLGVFNAAPTQSIASQSSAQAWLNSSEAKTALLILKSFTYNH